MGLDSLGVCTLRHDKLVSGHAGAEGTKEGRIWLGGMIVPALLTGHSRPLFEGELGPDVVNSIPNFVDGIDNPSLYI